MKMILLVLFTALSLNAASPRVIGGTVVPITEDKYESIAGLLYDDGDSNYRSQFCAGTLIAPTWVLTASHCLVGKSATGIKVMLDNYDLQETGTIKYVKRIIMHEEYDHDNLINDIALLELATPATSVTPLHMHSSGSLSVGQSAWSAGWGNTEKDSTLPPIHPLALREAMLPIVDTDICNGIDAYNGEITENNICAGYTNGTKGSCQGDSGGPLIVENNGRYELAGIVSWGKGCATPNYPGVYTKVQKYTAWIHKHTTRSNTRVQRVKESYKIVQTAGKTYVGNATDQTYSLNPNTLEAGDTIVIIDKGGNNTIELVGGLAIASAKVVSNELLLNLSNGTSINIRGADTFSYDVGANKNTGITGTKESFDTFLKNRLGLVNTPSKGQAVVNVGAVDTIVDGGK